MMDPYQSELQSMYLSLPGDLQSNICIVVYV